MKLINTIESETKTHWRSTPDKISLWQDDLDLSDN